MGVRLGRQTDRERQWSMCVRVVCVREALSVQCQSWLCELTLIIVFTASLPSQATIAVAKALYFKKVATRRTENGFLGCVCVRVCAILEFNNRLANGRN